MKKSNIRALSMLLAAIVISALMVPGVCAEKTTSVTAFYNEMGGKEMSAGEYLEIVDPDAFSTLTDEQKAQFYAMRVPVPDLTQNVAQTSAKLEATDDTRRDIIYQVVNDVDLAPIPFGISWFANSKASSIFPDMHVTAQFFYSDDDGSSWTEIDEGSADGQSTRFVETGKIHWFPSEGHYKVASVHWGSYPPGATPSSYFVSLVTGEMPYS